MLVALGLLLLNVTAFGAADLGSLAEPHETPPVGPLVGSPFDALAEAATEGLAAPSETVAAPTSEPAANLPIEAAVPPDPDASHRSDSEPGAVPVGPSSIDASPPTATDVVPMQPQPQRIPAGSPSLPDPGVHLPLPCFITHGDTISATACPGDVLARPPAKVEPDPEPPGHNLTAPESGEPSPWRWASESSRLPLSYGYAGPQPAPVPTAEQPPLSFAPDDEKVAPAPVTTDVVLAWVGRAAAVLAPTILLAKLLASLAIRRRRRESPARDALLALVAADPGIHYMELVRRSGLGNGTVQHHLRALLESGEVVRVRTAGHACFFPDATGDPAVVAVRTAVRSPVARQVIDLLQAGPRSLSALAAAAQLPVSTVHYHVGKLTRAGALAPQRVGGRRAIALTPLGRQALASAQ